jgi:DNA-binding transcriptional regulator YdaS (Cro superfamily)
VVGPSERTLARALEIAGSRARLAEALGASEHDLDSWLSGKAALPHHVFIAALDIVAAGSAPVRHKRGDRR